MPYTDTPPKLHRPADAERVRERRENLLTYYKAHADRGYMPSMREAARHAGVTVHTIGRDLADLERAGRLVRIIDPRGVMRGVRFDDRMRVLTPAGDTYTLPELVSALTEANSTTAYTDVVRVRATASGEVEAVTLVAQREG